VGSGTDDQDVEPRVDIVVPLYNKEAWVAGTLDSILAQTHGNWRLVVVDDGSSDNSTGIVRQYLSDDRIRLVSQANAGPGPARNYGASLGEAPFLAFPDADDRWLPGFLETTLRALDEHPDCAMAATTAYRGAWEARAPHGVAPGIEAGVWRCPTDIEPALLRAATAFFTPSAVLIRRRTFDSFGGFYDRSFCTYAEDSYLYLQVIMHCPVFRILEPCFWRNIDGSELAEGRTTPYPVSPHIRHGDELLAECPPSHRETLRRFIDWHAVWEGRRLARQGEGRQAIQLLRQRFPHGVPDEHAETVRTIRLWARAWPFVRLARRSKAHLRRAPV
jgi:glycosyltransferase involved in cell wall biosynthesis